MELHVSIMNSYELIWSLLIMNYPYIILSSSFRYNNNNKAENMYYYESTNPHWYSIGAEGFRQFVKVQMTILSQKHDCNINTMIIDFNRTLYHYYSIISYTKILFIKTMSRIFTFHFVFIFILNLWSWSNFSLLF